VSTRMSPPRATLSWARCKVAHGDVTEPQEELSMPQLATHILDGSGADIDVPGSAANNPSKASEPTNLLTDSPIGKTSEPPCDEPQFTWHVHSRNSRNKSLLGTWHLMGGTEPCCDAIGIQVGRQPQSAWPNHQLMGQAFFGSRFRDRTPGPPHPAVRDRNPSKRVTAAVPPIAAPVTEWAICSKRRPPQTDPLK
jgi:hypothetical protein